MTSIVTVHLLVNDNNKDRIEAGIQEMLATAAEPVEEGETSWILDSSIRSILPYAGIQQFAACNHSYVKSSTMTKSVDGKSQTYVEMGNFKTGWTASYENGMVTLARIKLISIHKFKTAGQSIELPSLSNYSTTFPALDMIDVARASIAFIKNS